MTYQGRRHQRGRDDREDERNNLPTGMILDKLDHVAQEMAKLTTRFDALPDFFIPRREYQVEMSAVKDRQSDLHARLTAMEEWRLSQTQIAASQQLQTQQQVTSATSDQSGKREELMRLGLSLMGSALISLLVFILSYLLTHK